jgi:hypothetical protein
MLDILPHFCYAYGVRELALTQARMQEGLRMEVQAYCVKCKAPRKMKDAKEVMMKNGRPAAKGVCPVCGTSMFKFLPKK